MLIAIALIICRQLSQWRAGALDKLLAGLPKEVSEFFSQPGLFRGHPHCLKRFSLTAKREALLARGIHHMSGIITSAGGQQFVVSSTLHVLLVLAETVQAAYSEAKLDPFTNEGLAKIVAADGEEKWKAVWHKVTEIKTPPWSTFPPGKCSSEQNLHGVYAVPLQFAVLCSLQLSLGLIFAVFWS